MRGKFIDSNSYIINFKGKTINELSTEDTYRKKIILKNQK